ncbi:4-oxalomesaconate tautomerase [Cupriavidus basilensis]|uniref:4-oxalomesaconate tautomerase n=1 Tax=Cupriavidus basilensis TaxID=68895 RepID=UPI0028511AEB|nr:4-oxalomesaconate tautomerase [Cupriavidus basilensis]MDR3382066.1 4-oxalomesaconate tautomerase [Cupriavidus basilensis]
MSKDIPCVLMRGGTSRGPLFRADWLPDDPARRDQVLLSAMGSPHALQVDGLGGGSSLTSKAAIVSRSHRPGCDIDYLFAQVAVDRNRVDTRPNCGNMLAAVAPFAIEEGLVQAGQCATTIRIFNVNTSSVVEAVVQTPGGQVTYAGDTRIDGVAGTAAPIMLNFLDAWGRVTGAMFPTGNTIDVIDEVLVTCIDAAMPLVVVNAASLGVRGDETAAALDANQAMLARLESLRREAGRRMGLGDVSNSVIPKPVLVSRHGRANEITSRYFTPLHCHAAHAVTGAVGIAAAYCVPGTVANGLASTPSPEGRIVVHHPAGSIEVNVELERDGGPLRLRRIGLVRTARRIMKGMLSVPDEVLG